MFSGSLVAIATPMRPEGAVDFDAWAGLVDFHLANGTNGIVVGGTTGESATLLDSELRELTARASERVRRRIAVIVGAGTSSTATTVERVRWLSELPVDGLLVVTPAYNRPTQEGLYLHFAAVAHAARKPVILYNVPARTAVDMKPATVGRLSQLAGIVAVKEAVTEPERVRDLREALEKQFSRFEELMGRPPTHLDSHHNLHRDPKALPDFLGLAAKHGLPLREHSPVRYFSKFYGQWGGKTHFEQISVKSLRRMLETEIEDGLTELSCHPGYVEADYVTGYSVERQAELRTLCDPVIREVLAARSIQLISYHERGKIPFNAPQ